jgi:hypothetical protein
LSKKLFSKKLHNQWRSKKRLDSLLKKKSQEKQLSKKLHNQWRWKNKLPNP